MIVVFLIKTKPHAKVSLAALGILEGASVEALEVEDGANQLSSRSVLAMLPDELLKQPVK